MVNVPLDTYTPPPKEEEEEEEEVLVLPLIFEPLFITSVPPFTRTNGAVLPDRPCKVTPLPKVRVTPLSTVKSEPVPLKLTVRADVPPPSMVIRTFLPLAGSGREAIVSLFCKVMVYEPPATALPLIHVNDASSDKPEGRSLFCCSSDRWEGNISSHPVSTDSAAHRTAIAGAAFRILARFLPFAFIYSAPF
jgi:hypothetical protein